MSAPVADALPQRATREKRVRKVVAEEVEDTKTKSTTAAATTTSTSEKKEDTKDEVKNYECNNSHTTLII
jgi:hypothetical protein